MLNGEAGRNYDSGYCQLGDRAVVPAGLGVARRRFTWIRVPAHTVSVNGLSSGTLNIQISFITTGFSMVLAALFAILLFVIIRFSINYLHREAGFHRFFFILSLFASAMLLLVLSGNASELS